MSHLLATTQTVAAVAALAYGGLLVHPGSGVGDCRKGPRIRPAQVNVHRDGEEVLSLVDVDEAVEVGRLFFFFFFLVWGCEVSK